MTEKASKSIFKNKLFVVNEYNSDAFPAPNKIKLREGGPVGRFGKCEVEVSAGKLLSFLQDRGLGWKGFKLLELIDFYKSNGWDPNNLIFGLAGMWFDDGMGILDYRQSWSYLAVDDFANMHVTSYFIEACMRP